MRFISFLFPILFLSTFATADTLRVPEDYPTIQGAIEQAEDLDEIVVSPGTYQETIDFLGKAITLRSSDGPEVTVIESPSSNPLVYISECWTYTPVLDGFTLRDIDNYATTAIILCYDTRATIENNIIKDFHVWGLGAIVCHKSPALVTGNIISDNYLDGSMHGSSGGIHCLFCNPRITLNTIQDNAIFGNGGGIYCENAFAMIEYNQIIRNSPAGIFCTNSCGHIHTNVICESGNQGGIACNLNSSPSIHANLISHTDGGSGIACYMNSSPFIANNMIFRNSNTGFDGGGIRCYRFSSPTISCNTVYTNSAPRGGGISSDDYSWPLISNSIFWGNSATEGPEIYIGNTSGASALTIAYCDVQGGQANVHLASNSYLDWGDGMIDVDPLFVDAAQDDLHLLYTSPCKDAGNSGVYNPPSLDFEGHSRYGQPVDLGADEFSRHFLYYTGDATPGASIKIKITEKPHQGPVFLWAGSGVLPDAMNTNFGKWHLQFPLIFGAELGFMPPEGLVEYEYTFPPDFPVPLEIPLQSLSGQFLTNLLVMEVKE